MIRPPSNQKQYDDCYSKDQAFVPMPDSPTEKQIEDRARLVRVAREQGDWSALLVEGHAPTVFTFNPLRGDVLRKLFDLMGSGRLGAGSASQLAFRAALSDISNLGVEYKIKGRALDDAYPELGPMVKVDLADLLDRSDTGIIAELGGEVIKRAQGVSPK